MKRVKLGQYIVIDPDICHGKPTFTGTRIMVEQVLEMVAEGTVWEQIIREYDGAISREAIAEAVRLASRQTQTCNKLAEVTPQSVRLRKKIVKLTDRPRWREKVDITPPRYRILSPPN